MAQWIQAYGPSNDQSTQLNFFRYAMPIANGHTSAFVSYAATDGGARVWVYPFSPAIEAGLQTGDIVQAINGKSLVGLNQVALMATIQSQYAARYIDLTVVNGDGATEHIEFELKDLRWFVDHRGLPT